MLQITPCIGQEEGYWKGGAVEGVVATASVGGQIMESSRTRKDAAGRSDRDVGTTEDEP